MLLGEEAGEAVDLDGEGDWILEDWEGVGDDAGGCELVGFVPIGPRQISGELPHTV